MAYCIKIDKTCDKNIRHNEKLYIGHSGFAPK